MALATQCPHCGTLFRVAADQLKLRGGIVRCGACQQVFDGSAALIDLGTTTAPPPQPAPVMDRAVPTGAVRAGAVQAGAVRAGAEPGDDDQPIYTLEFDRTFAPFGILPRTANPVTPAPASSAPSQPSIAPPPVPAPVPGAKPSALPAVAAERAPTRSAPTNPAHDVAPLLRKASSGVTSSPAPAAPSSPAVAARARMGDPRGRRSQLAPTRITPAPRLRVPESDEPDFIRRARAPDTSSRGRKIALALLCLLLAATLLLQGAFGARDLLAAHYPALRPALSQACTLLGCRVGLPRRADSLAIDTGELITLGEQAYTFQTQLRNLGELPLAWPSLELTLLDGRDQAMVRRVFSPRDYLGPRASLDAGLGALTEQPVNIHFKLEGSTPSGYHIAVFYP